MGRKGTMSHDRVGIMEKEKRFVKVIALDHFSLYDFKAEVIPTDITSESSLLTFTGEVFAENDTYLIIKSSEAIYKTPEDSKFDLKVKHQTDFHFVIKNDILKTIELKEC